MTEPAPASATATDRAPRAVLARVLVAAVCTLLAIELAFRAAGPALLPEPQEWPSNLAEAHVRAMARERRIGGAGGVALIGTSQMRRLDPGVLVEAGVADAAYNASVDGATLRVQRRWLADAVLPQLDPSTVVLGITALDVQVRTFAMEARFADARATATDWLGTLEREAAERSVAVHLRPSVRGPARTLASLLEDPAPVLNRLTDRGAFAGNDTLPPARIREADVLGARRWVFDQTKVDEIGAIAAQLRAADVELVVALLPSSDRWEGALPNGERDLERAQDAIRAEVQQHDLQLVDLTIGRGAAEQFNDVVHLRPAEARAAATELAVALGGHAPPPDRRTAVVHTTATDPDLAMPVASVALVRPGVLEVQLDEGAPSIDRSILTINPITQVRWRIRVVINGASRAAIVQHLEPEGWIDTGVATIAAADERRFTIALPRLAMTANPPLLWFRWQAVGSATSSRTQPVALADLLGRGSSSTPRRVWATAERDPRLIGLPAGSTVTDDGATLRWALQQREVDGEDGTTTAMEDVLVLRSPAGLLDEAIELRADRSGRTLRTACCSDAVLASALTWAEDESDGVVVTIDLVALGDALGRDLEGWSVAPQRRWSLPGGDERTATGVGLVQLDLPHG